MRPLKAIFTHRHHLSTLVLISLALIVSGCTLFNPLAPVEAEARLVCDYLNDKYGKNEAAFTLATRKSNNSLMQNFCFFKAGLVLPDDPNFKNMSKKPLPLIMKNIAKKVDKDKLRGKKPEHKHEDMAQSK